MEKILLILLLTIIKSYLYDQSYIFQKLLEDNEDFEKKFFEPGVSKTFPIKYFQQTKLSFNHIKNDSLQVNIHSINCNININSEGNTVNKININTYYLLINPPNESINIEPIKDIEDGEYKENYGEKNCYLSINSYFLNNSEIKLQIENKEDNIIYYNHSKYNLFQISYEIKDIKNDSFILLNLRFEDNPFSINISYFLHNTFIKTISNINSTNIYLNSDFLLKNDKSVEAIGQNGSIYINISNQIENKSSIIHFKIIEKNTVCLLEKNALNFGFLTTNTTYQYYYTEIFNGEEGELILHNKRFDGILNGIIIEKSKLEEDDLTNISIYPNSSSKELLLDYNQHYLQLKYNYKNTSRCINGCYLLITYERLPITSDIPLVGYEFTILSRTWNYTDYISQIIDIPFNEFIIGCFFTDTATNHFYSMYIPNDAEKIVLEIESNYLDFFYDEGRKRINSINPVDSTKKLLMKDNENVITLNVTDLGYFGNYISFALRPKNYDTNIFSFYYFRVLYFKEKEPIFYPIDSYLGNLCIPEYNEESEAYFCNFILENKYNESNLKFVITSINQNEYYKINVSKVFINTNTNMSKKTHEFVYLYNNKTNDISHFKFKFNFSNSEIKNVIIAFSDGIDNIIPQIYSKQMFLIDNFTKTNNFNLKQNYSLIYQYTYGNFGYFNFPDFIYKFALVRNYKGRPLFISIDENFKNTSNKAEKEFSYYYYLKYNNKNRGIEEVKLGEPISHIINRGQFPLYFYLKLKEKKDINIIVNLRLKADIESELDDDIEINGYLLNENDITRKINGEFIQFKDPIEGNYSNGFDMGYLEIIREYNENISYLLIEIQKKENPILNSYIIIDIVPKEYNNDTYGLPINRYIFETFDDINNSKRESNQYHINIDQIDNTSDVLIELYSQCDDINIEFENLKNITPFFLGGFKKYRIKNYTNTDDYNIFFRVLKPNNTSCTNTNYMIRYFYTEYKEEYEYFLNGNYDYEEISSNDNYVNISLTFPSITIKTGEHHERKPFRKNIYFLITGILYKKDEPLDICINTSEIKTRQGKYFTKTLKHDYVNETGIGKFTLTFENIPRNSSYLYNLQFQVNVIITKHLLIEEYQIFNTTVDLTGIKLKNDKILIIVASIIGGILVIVAIFFIIKYLRLRKVGDNLKKEIKSIEFSNDAQKNVLIKEKQISKNEKDYETTFI